MVGVALRNPKPETRNLYWPTSGTTVLLQRQSHYIGFCQKFNDLMQKNASKRCWPLRDYRPYKPNKKWLYLAQKRSLLISTPGGFPSENIMCVIALGSEIKVECQQKGVFCTSHLVCIVRFWSSLYVWLDTLIISSICSVCTCEWWDVSKLKRKHNQIKVE